MRTRYVVGLAVVENRYGGPEEGGWYYEAGRPFGRYRTFFKAESAYAYRNELSERIASGERFRGVGVGGCGDDDGMSPGEICGEGLRAVVQSTSTRSRAGLEAWPLYTPGYS